MLSSFDERNCTKSIRSELLLTSVVEVYNYLVKLKQTTTSGFFLVPLSATISLLFLFVFSFHRLSDYIYPYFSISLSTLPPRTLTITVCYSFCLPVTPPNSTTPSRSLTNLPGMSSVRLCLNQRSSKYFYHRLFKSPGNFKKNPTTIFYISAVEN